MKSQSFGFGLVASILASSIAVAPAQAHSVSSDTQSPTRGQSAGGAQFGFADVFVYCTSLPNSTGRPCAIDSTGSLSIAANTFTLLARGVPPSTTGMFIYGIDHAEFPMGDGVLCISPLVPGILSLQPSVPPTAAGIVRKKLNFPALSGVGLIPPGATRYFQYMYRDTTPAGVNFSDGLAATFAP